MTDKEMIRLLSVPSMRRQAFEELVKQYSESLYWKIRRMVISHDDADDVLQNTFVKAWTNLDHFQARSSLSTWLYRIAINEALDFLRRKKKRQDVSQEEYEGLANRLMADEFFDGDEVQAQFQEAISQLPDVQRTVFNLRYYNDMKYTQMSEILGTSEGALKASYHLAVKKIIEFFKHND